jgi:hypothetical protein
MRASLLFLALPALVLVRALAHDDCCTPQFDIELRTPLDRFVVSDGLCISGPGRYRHIFPGGVALLPPNLNDTSTIVSKTTIECTNCKGLRAGALPDNQCTIERDGVEYHLVPQFSVTPFQPSPVDYILATVPGPGPLFLIDGCTWRSIIFSLPDTDYCDLIGHTYRFLVTYYDEFGCATSTVERFWTPDSSCNGQCQTQCPLTNGVAPAG